MLSNKDCDCRSLCEVKMLEEKLDGIFSSMKDFKGQLVTNKSIFQLENIRAKISAKSNSSNNYIFLVLSTSIIFAYIFNIGFSGGLIEVLVGVIVIAPMLFITSYFLEKKNQKINERDLYAMHLLDMLIERKKEKQMRYSKRNIRKKTSHI